MRDVDVRKDVQVRQPVGDGTGLFPIRLGFAQFLPRLSCHIAALKAQVVAIAVTSNCHLHVPGSVLRGAGSQPVQPQGKTIVSGGVVVILAACIKFTVNQLPVPALLTAVPVQRAASAEVLHFDALIPVIGQDDQVTVSFACFVNGVGEDLEYCVLAAIQSVRAENDSRTQSDTVSSLQLGNAVIAVLGGGVFFCRFCFCHSTPLQ